MHDLKDACKIAVVQATPVMFDADACVKKGALPHGGGGIKWG